MAVIVLVWAQGICISRQPVEISPGQADLVQLQEKKKTKSEKNWKIPSSYFFDPVPRLWKYLYDRTWREYTNQPQIYLLNIKIVHKT